MEWLVLGWLGMCAFGAWHLSGRVEDEQVAMREASIRRRQREAAAGPVARWEAEEREEARRRKILDS